jgi:16S rRNA (uracil1498-N3)-methyltransferase
LRLTRVFVAAALAPGTIVDLPAEAAAHLARVLRARAGDELVLFAGDGFEYAGEIDSVRGSRVSVSVGRGTPIDRESPLQLTLVQCVPRGDRMDLIVQKATELGVTRIVPVLSQRSVVRLGAAQAESKTAHWRAVSVNACEQCGRNRLPVIEPPAPLITYLGRDPVAPAARWVLEPESGQAAPTAPATAAEIAVGPEGGFADDELEAFRIAGFARLTLGPRILRTETAAIAAIAWWQTRFGDLSGRQNLWNL